MTIKRGETWGDTGPFPPGGVVAATDAAAGAYVTGWRRDDAESMPMGLGGGDLCATLGGRGGSGRFTAPATGGPTAFARLVIDVGRVEIDGEAPRYFVAHCVARRTWWRGRVVAVMNAAWLGSWNVAPRAHPGDGRFDLVDADLSFGDRLKARNRLKLGTHLPHPQIAVRQFRETTIEFDKPTRVWLDGQAVGSARRLHITVEPEAQRVLV